MGGGALMAGTVHVWTIGLDAEPSTVSSLLQLLSGEERARAARLRTSELRVRFVVAHGALRTILSRYVGVSPANITYAQTASGKPILAGPAIAFNLSHSEGLALCAVATGGQIGVDLERLRRIDDSDSIVQKYFAPGELRQYSAIRPAERTAAFFSAWTRKEAFVKATGAGLRDLRSFEVEVSPQAVRPWVVSDAADVHTWSLRAFAPRPQYVAAVALDHEIEALEFFDWSTPQ